jgi:hypothetical protein
MYFEGKECREQKVINRIKVRKTEKSINSG